MATAIATDLDVVQGETKVFSATWTINDVPKPLTGAGHNYAAHLQVRRRRTLTATLLIDVSSLDDSPAIVLEPDAAIGKVRVRLPGALTALFKRNAQYDLWVINQEDTTERVRLMFGTMLVSKSSTDNSEIVTVIETENPTP